MTTNSAELKHCPFCGSDMSSFVPEPEGCAGGGAGDYYVECDCGAMGAGGKTVAEAIAGWNRRTAAQGEQSKEAAGYCADCNSWGGKHTEGCQRRPERFFNPSNKAGSADQVSEPCACWPGRMCDKVEKCASDVRQIQDETQLAIDLASVAHNHVENGEMRHDVGIALLDVVRKHAAQEPKPDPSEIPTLEQMRELLAAPERKVTDAQVDWLGLALDLEQQAKRVESQTVERAMNAAAHGLRLMGAALKQGEQTAPEGSNP